MATLASRASISITGAQIANGSITGTQINATSVKAAVMNQGSATLVAGTVAITNANVVAGSNITLSGGALNSSTATGDLTITAIVAGVSFTVTSITAGAVTTQTGDLRTVYYSF
jgi:hypothetical protein